MPADPHRRTTMWSETMRGAFIAVTGALALLLVTGFLCPRAASADMVIQLVERASTDTVTDTGNKGDTAGDILTFANDIYDAANKTKLGTDNSWCIRTVPGKAWEYFWTLTLEEGQITVEGPFLDAGDSILSVTGGTGAYVGARGEMALHARDDKGAEYDFKYSLK
jgi:allene oxide cyclase